MNLGAMPEFVLIGRGTLALACGKHLTERSLPILAVVSDDTDLQQWARANNLPCTPTLATLINVVRQRAPVLLSIANEQLIAAQVLALFSFAVNFHDGPLPRYAGSHVTSWALMARERTYSVTWHRMIAATDAGEVLMRVPIVLTPDETALTLNAKCHDAALKSFPHLLERLLANNRSGEQQYLLQRTFYPRDRRPADAAVLDWGRQADDVWAMVRALSCGPYVNRLGLPKVWLGKTFAAVQQLTVCTARSSAAPGTVVSTAPRLLRIATGSHDVMLSEFLTLEGCPLDVPHLLQVAGRHEGTILPPVPLAIVKEAAQFACGWKQEAQWMHDLQHLRPATAPIDSCIDRGLSIEQSVVLPASKEGLRSKDAAMFAFAAVLCYLARFSGIEMFDIGVRCRRTETQWGEGNPLLACTRPLRIDADFGQSFERFQENCWARLKAWQTRRPYLRDAVLRYPDLIRPYGWKDFASWPVLIEFSAGNAATQDRVFDSSALIFVIAPSGQVTLVRSGLQNTKRAQVASQIATLATNCLTQPSLPIGKLNLLPPQALPPLQREISSKRLSV